MTISGRSESVEMYLKSLAELGGAASSIPIGQVAELPIGQSAMIQAISPESSEILRYQANKNLPPSNEVTIIEAEPLDGPLTLLVKREYGKSEVIIGLNLASSILMELK